MAQRRQYGTGSVYRLPNGNWRGAAEAGFNAKGDRRRVTVTAKTEAEAKRRLRDKIRQLEMTGPTDANAGTTVRMFADEWLEREAQRLRPKTWANYRSTTRNWIIPAIGHLRLDRLTPGSVREVGKQVRAAGRSSSTAALAHTILLIMLRAAIADGHPIPVRLLEIDGPGLAVSDRQAIGLAEARKLLDVAASRSDRSRWIAAILQGMRQGECLGLTWECVDLDAATIDVSWQLQRLQRTERFSRTAPLRVPDGYEHRVLDGTLCLVRPKTSRGQRIIPMVPWVTAALMEWKAIAPASPHGLVWPRPDGSPRRDSEDRADWKALQSEAGIAHPSGREFVGHEARHTTATLLLEAGVDPHTVTAILGHSSITTSRGYQHVSTALARQAMEAVAARLELQP